MSRKRATISERSWETSRTQCYISMRRARTSRSRLLPNGWRARCGRPIPSRSEGLSEFDVQPRGEDVDRAAILVVSGIADELVVEAQRHRLDHAIAVVGLDNALRRVAETPVADEDAGAAGGEKIAMHL